MAPHSFSTRPLYLQLRDALAERIETGQWQPGTCIPNEHDLAREFDVSAGTMRKALGIMEDEYLIARRQGRGTFVNDPASDSLANRFNNVRGSDGRPLIGRIETTNLSEGGANKSECLRLQLRDQDPVWRIRRSRFHNDQVFMREEVSLPVELFPKMENGGSNCIVVLAKRHGVLLGAAQELITVSAASGETAEALDLVEGSPIVVLDRVVRTIHGRPAEWRVGQCRLSANYYLAHMR
jgi:GntR family transcriptional regulator